jgi:hypothetical protein
MQVAEQGWERGGVLKRHESFSQTFSIPLKYIMSVLQVLMDLGGEGLP